MKPFNKKANEICREKHGVNPISLLLNERDNRDVWSKFDFPRQNNSGTTGSSTNQRVNRSVGV